MKDNKNYKIDKKECSLSVDDTLRKLPKITAEVYNNLPEFISEIVEQYDNGREKDCILLSLLTALGASFSTVSTIHFKKRVFPNLFLFITAPAGNGKGIVNDVNEYFGLFHKTIRNEKHNMNRFFLPGDSSHAAFVKALVRNNGTGLIFESEADELSNTFSQEWGNFSTVLRKGFHHERISQLRINDDIDYEINNPKFGVLLCGTPNQVPSLFHHKDNGLVSRFLYYGFSQELKFKCGQNIGPMIEKYDLAASIEELIYQTLEKDINVVFSEELWEKHTKVMSEIFELSIADYGTDVSQIINRLGLICFKLAMILTIVRNAGKLYNNVECQVKDFDIAISIIKTLQEHSLMIYEALPSLKAHRLRFKRIPKLHVYDKLPEEFITPEALEIFASNDFERRTAFKTLAEWQPDYLISEKKGHYKKVN